MLSSIVQKVYERSGKNLFWSIKNSGEILDKLKARDFNASSLSTYDFSTLYTTVTHNLIKVKLVVFYCEFVTFPLVSWVRCGT